MSKKSKRDAELLLTDRKVRKIVSNNPYESVSLSDRIAAMKIRISHSNEIERKTLADAKNIGRKK